MEREKSIARSNPDEQPFFDDQDLVEASVAAESRTNPNVSWRIRYKNPDLKCDETPETNETDPGSEPNYESRVNDYSMSLDEFVQTRFIPEYVAIRKPAGRAHLRAILRYVLTPEQVMSEFAVKREKSKVTLRDVSGWPYLGFLPLCEVNADVIQHLTSTALKSGYSIQTVTHIRSVVRAIFSHAISTNHYSGINPAALVTLPRMARKQPHALTITQLKELIPVMRYPEKHIALIATLTDLNLSEICGLQWRYVNLSNDRQMVDGDWIPGKTIAVRRQSYRGLLGVAADARRRLAPVPELLCSILSEIRSRKRFTGPEDFVFASRKGTLIYPENIAARRLKPIGRTLEMPWLSWHVFHRTYATLGRQLQKELNSSYRSPSL